jgi:hypothetical protein
MLISALVAAAWHSPKVIAAIADLKKDALSAGKDQGKKALIGSLTPSALEKAAKSALELFAIEWDKELEATGILATAEDGYRDQLGKLLEVAAAEIAEPLSPETRTVDLSTIESFWSSLGNDPLPEDFSWSRVAQNYARAINLFIKRDPEMRAQYDTALAERTADAARSIQTATELFAGIDPGFNVAAYRTFLIENKCNALQLAALHTSTYAHDRKLLLWSIFVEPSARESIPFTDTPPELLRLMRKEGHLAPESDTESGDLPDESTNLASLRERFQSSPIRPIFEILNRERLVVVTGDPGSGKTSLLKYRALQWAHPQSSSSEPALPLPLLIDLKEYAASSPDTAKDLVHYCHAGKGVFRFNDRQLDLLLKSGEAAFYLDGLDEVFDPHTRGLILEEIAVLATRYPTARFLVTSRKIGYDPQRLTAAGFLHATIEDFDQTQMLAFLSLWHPLAEPLEAERALQQARMERAIAESQPIRELAGNPLLLTMMAILNRTQELPRNRVALYREASRVLLDDWDARKTISVSEFDRQDKESLLRELAGDMQQGEGGLAGNLIGRARLLKRFESFLDNLRTPDFRRKARELVRQLSERNFILAYAGAERFCFVHRTFLEYFCAAWFVERLQVKRELSFDQLRDEVFAVHWRDEKWHEVLRLIAGMISPEDAGRLIEFLMDQTEDSLLLENLTFAGSLLNEVRNRKAIAATNAALRTRFSAEIERYFPDPNLTDSKGKGVNWIKAIAVQRTLLHWFAVLWREEDARPWLIAATGASSERLQCAAIMELARTWPNDSEILALLRDRALHDKSSAVRNAALAELVDGWPDDPQTLALVNSLARTEPRELVRNDALQLLAGTWPNHPETLPILKQAASDSEIPDAAFNALSELARGWPHDPDVLPMVQERILHEVNEFLRAFMIDLLAETWPGHPETIPFIMDRALLDESGEVHAKSIQILVRLRPGHPENQIAFRREFPKP